MSPDPSASTTALDGEGPSAAEVLVETAREFDDPDPTFERHTNKRDVRKLVRDYGILLVFAALFISLAASAPNFLTTANLLNVLNSNAYIGITACGTTLVIIGGNFDLSVGYCYALAGIMAAWFTVHLGSAPVGMAAAIIIVGVAVGLANALLINIVKVHSFLATLATSLVLSGIGLAITDGYQIFIPEDNYNGFIWLSQETTIGQIPNSVVAFALVVVILWFLLAKTRYGRYIYAAGGNPEAARLSGIRVGLVTTGTLVIGATCAALAGVIGASLAGAGQASPGGTMSLPLDAIAAVVIGGTSILGGQGAMWRTVVGVLFIALINNAFNLNGWNSSYLATTTGLLIIIAVSANSLVRPSRSS